MIPFKHVLESQQFSVDWLERVLFPLATEMEGVVTRGGTDCLKGKRMATLFYEPSTRTRASFEMAMDFLGGRVVFPTENAREFSSAVKGESLQDTIRVLNRYRPNVIVLRHYEDDAATVAADVSEFSHIINAGSGRGQHPTQALLDIYTIRRRMRQISGITVAMVGDLKNGRTVRSLAYLLGKYAAVDIVFVSPPELGVKDDIKEYLQRHKVTFSESDNLAAVASHADVIYATRMQKERGGDMSEEQAARIRVDKAILAAMKPSAILMHPLPRNSEISQECDNDPRCVYMREQIDAGLYTRMALLKLLLS